MAKGFDCYLNYDLISIPALMESETLFIGPKENVEIFMSGVVS